MPNKHDELYDLLEYLIEYEKTELCPIENFQAEIECAEKDNPERKDEYGLMPKCGKCALNWICKFKRKINL